MFSHLKFFSLYSLWISVERIRCINISQMKLKKILFIPQGFDGIQSCSLAGRIEAKENSHGRGKPDT